MVAHANCRVFHFDWGPFSSCASAVGERVRLKDPLGLHTGAAAELHVTAQRSLHFWNAI